MSGQITVIPSRFTAGFFLRMDPQTKKGLKIFAAMAVVIILVGIVMLIVDATADGRVGGGRTGGARDASINGWGVLFIGFALLAIAFFSIPKSRE